MDIDEIVIGNITKLMKAHGLTQKQLASNAKINYQNLNRLLKKKRSIAKSDVLSDIAKYFKVTVTDLHYSPSTKKPLEIVETPKDEILSRLESIELKIDKKEGPSMDQQRKELLDLTGGLSTSEMDTLLGVVKRWRAGKLNTRREP